ncbi:MAG: exo-alpha-sialidase, partial [Clostridia bacterium]|nr:exo-alpha-sialidase [Clostridia bacterium]
LAANADHCLLDDGSILCVYSVRPCNGYTKPEYLTLNRIDMIRGTVNKNGYIIWSDPVPIYYGHNWEPEIIQRENGTIEIYFTHIAPMIHAYGFHSEFRSSGVGMLSSTDNGLTWSPNVTANSSSTHYTAKRVYQYNAGKFTVQSGATVDFFCGQMPGVVELTNGKLMIAVEEKKVTGGNFKLGAAWSDANGEWKELAMDEAGPSTMQADILTGAGPTLSRFDSGEVLLTYNASSLMNIKVLDKTGSNIATAHALVPFQNQAAGFWSFSSIIDSHTAMAGMAHKKYAGIEYETTTNENGEEVTTLHNTITLAKFRLNHKIEATEKTMNVDGNLKDWKYIDDALFVGSQKRTFQSAYRFAYDDNYIYIGIDRVDNAYESGDYNYVNIATADGYYNVKVGNDVSPGISGVSFTNAGVTGGRTYEIRIDRKALGLDGEFIRVSPGLVDVGTDVDDRINGTSATDTSTWIKINLK